MTDVNSGIPTTVTAIQFAKQAATVSMFGIWPVAETVRRDDPALEAAFCRDYGKTNSDIDAFFTAAALL